VMPTLRCSLRLVARGTQLPAVAVTVTGKGRSAGGGAARLISERGSAPGASAAHQTTRHKRVVVELHTVCRVLCAV
jgi:hypothetical protein